MRRLLWAAIELGPSVTRRAGRILVHSNPASSQLSEDEVSGQLARALESARSPAPPPLLPFDTAIVITPSEQLCSILLRHSRRALQAVLVGDTLSHPTRWGRGSSSVITPRRRSSRAGLVAFRVNPSDIGRPSSVPECSCRFPRNRIPHRLELLHTRGRRTAAYQELSRRCQALALLFTTRKALLPPQHPPSHRRALTPSQLTAVGYSRGYPQSRRSWREGCRRGCE